MSEARRLLKNTGIIAIGNVSTRLISFLLLPLYTALLTTKDYGVMDYMTTLAVFIVPFVSMVMDEAVFRFLVDCKTDERRRARFSQAFFLICCGLAAYIPAAAAVLILLRYAHGWFLVVYVAASALSAIVSAYFRGTGQMKRYTLFGFVGSSLAIAFNVLLVAVFRMGLTGMMLATAGAACLSTTAFFVKYGIYRGISLNLVKREELRDLLRYALPLIPNRICWNAVNLLNRVLIINTLGSGMNGLYALGCRFSALVNTAYGFFYQAWMESAARAKTCLGDGGAGAYYNGVYKSVKRVMLSLVLCLTAAFPVIYRILINESFHESMQIVPILLMTVYFDGLSSFLGGICAAYMNTRVMGTTTAIAAAVSCSFCVASIRRLGLYAAAFAPLIAYAAAFVLRRRFVVRHVAMGRDGRWGLSAVIVTIAVEGMFYSGNAMLRVAMLPTAIVFAIFSNRTMLRSLFGKEAAPDD